METSNVNNKFSNKRNLVITLSVAAVLVLSVLAGGAWLLSSQGCDHTFCANLDIIFVRSVTLSSNGWVTFNMTGAQAYSHNVTTVTAYQEPYPSTRPNSPPLGFVSPSSNNFLPAKGILILSVQFQGITWQRSVNYTFVITTSGGPTIGVQGCLSGC